MADVPSNLVPTRITQLPEYVGSSQEGYVPYVIGGVTYKVQFSQVASAGEVPPSRTLTAGTGLTGGGDLSANRTFAIANGGVGYDQLALSGVVGGTYGAADEVAVITVDDKGRVTSATSTPISISGFVPTSTSVLAGDGLTGGGPLSGNVTLAVDFSSASPEPLGSASAGTSNVAAREDHVHPAVDLSDTTETEGVLPLGRGGTGYALSPVAGAVAFSTGSHLSLTTTGAAGQVLTSNGTSAPTWEDPSTGSGTVTSVDLAAGTGISVAGGPITTSGTITVTNTAPDQVVTLSAGTGISTSGTYPAFTITNSAPDQVVSLTAGSNVTITGSYPNFTIAASGGGGSGTVTSVDASGGTTGLTFSGGPITSSGTLTLGGTLAIASGGTGATTAATARVNILPSLSGNAGKILAVNVGESDVEWVSVGGTGTVTSVDVAGGTTGLTFSGGPITSAGTITMAGTLAVANGGTGATTASDARTNLGAAASGANSDITSLSGITGDISTVNSIAFDTTPSGTITTGELGWNVDDGTLNIGLNNGSVLQVGQEMMFYAKNTSGSTIPDGTPVMFTGTVGASGMLTFGLAVADGSVPADYMMGVTTQSIANNAFGYVTVFGLVRGIDTTGTPYGETWADGDLLYFDPATPGAWTNVEPTAPNIHLPVAVVVNAGSGGSGSIFVRMQISSRLSELQDVYINGTGTPLAGEVLIYDATQERWENHHLTAGTGISVTNGDGSISIANTAPDQVVSLTGAGTTSISGTYPNFTITSNDQYVGTVTSVNLTAGTGISVSGGPVTSSGSITVNNTAPMVYPGAGIAVSTGSAWGTSLTAPTGAVVGTTDTQTLTNKTITNLIFDGDFTEEVFAITDGGSVDLDPSNGTIQTWTLGASRSPTASSFAAGQSMTLMVDDGTAYTITWPSVTWVGGTAPTLATSGYTVIELWKVGTTLYGALVGSVA